MPLKSINQSISFFYLKELPKEEKRTLEINPFTLTNTSKLIFGVCASGEGCGMWSQSCGTELELETLGSNGGLKVGNHYPR